MIEERRRQGRMRVFGWCAALALACLAANGLHAADIPGARQPDSTIKTDTTTPASPSDIQPGPQIHIFPEQIPPAVAPSEPPSGYFAPIEPPAVPELIGDAIEFSGPFRTTFENGKPALTVSEGPVIVRYKDTVVTAQTARVDYKTNIAIFEGNVVFRIGIEEVHGERITLNLKTREWSVAQAKTTITPEYARGYLNAPVFAQGSTIQGLGRRRVSGYSIEATTCNLAVPHYDFTARSIVIYPNDKIVFRRVKMHALGRTIFSVPRFVLPLREIQKNPELIPRVGQSAEEGYYLKSSYPYMSTAGATGFFMLDLMTKKGIGKGIRQTYHTGGQGAGDLQIYQVFDENINENTLTGRLVHTQQLGTVRASITSNLRSNSYLYAPQSTTFNNQITLNRNVTGARTLLAINQNINNTFTRTSQLAANLTHQQQFGQRTSFDSSFDYTGFGTSTSSQGRLVSQMAVNRHEDKFDWNISAQKLTDLTDEAFVQNQRFAGIEKLPELSLISDSTRLGNILPFGIPANVKLSYGRYTELPNPDNIDRTFLELNTPVRRFNLSDNWTLGAGAGFKQYVYSDNTAQYSIDTSAELRRKLGKASSFALTYRKQAPRGFTPLLYDFVGKYNIANASLNLRDSSIFKLSFLTGYNFEQAQFPWQDATLRFSIEPNNSLLLYTATSYDFNRGQWRLLINQLRIRGGELFKLDLGTRYDPISKTLSEARIDLDTALGSKWHARALAGYNGFTKGFDYRKFMITRDLHCWEASLIYTDQGGFYLDKSLMLDLRIKALPLFNNFGAGQFGQALDTSVGQVY